MLRITHRPVRFSSFLFKSQPEVVKNPKKTSVYKIRWKNKTSGIEISSFIHTLAFMSGNKNKRNENEREKTIYQKKKKKERTLLYRMGI